MDKSKTRARWHSRALSSACNAAIGHLDQRKMIVLFMDRRTRRLSEESPAIRKHNLTEQKVANKTMLSFGGAVSPLSALQLGFHQPDYWLVNKHIPYDFSCLIIEQPP